MTKTTSTLSQNSQQVSNFILFLIENLIYKTPEKRAMVVNIFTLLNELILNTIIQF